MNLAEHQRALLALIVADPSLAEGPGDDYITSVSGSMQLEVVQDIGDSWRRFGLRRLCPLTWRLIEQRDRLTLHFDRFGRRRGLSPFLQILARQFLDELAGGDDPLDGAVARFERALIDGPRAGGGAAELGEVTIDWPCDPEELLSRLVADEPIGSPTPGRYRTRALSAAPESFSIELLPV